MGGKITSWWHSERGRKWAGELANIVLGVLIALMLGAVATEVGWRIEVAEAKSALGDELGEIVGQAHERERADGCIEAKFDAIGKIIDVGEKTGRLPPTGPIGRSLWRTWSRGVWDTTISTGVAGHFNRETLDNLSGAYEFVDIVRRLTDEEVAAWTQLYAIVGPGRAISTDEVAHLREALSQARVTHRYLLSAAMRVEQTVQAFDLPLDQGSVDDYRDSKPAGTCGPIEKPDGRGYGEAPARGVVERVQANPITRDEIGVPTR